MSHADTAPARHKRLPPWLKKRLPAGSDVFEVTRLLESLGLSTVCSGARCPNLPECYARRTATFLILGERCTRGCRFCAVPAGRPEPPDPSEPERVARACQRLGLRHVVITSVARDDLPDGGAGHFVAVIRAVRERLPHATVEVLTPDFLGDRASIDKVLAARPDVFNHNIETVARLYPAVRPQADYRRSLEVLRRAHQRRRSGSWRVRTKSGLMVGLGETNDEIVGVMRDLRDAGCEVLTIGQYLAPTSEHLPVARHVEPEQYEAWRAEASAMGFVAVAAGPFVRSSYEAEKVFRDATARESRG